MDKVTMAEAKLAGVCVMCGVVPPDPDWRDILLDEWHQYCWPCFWKSCEVLGETLASVAVHRLSKRKYETK